MVSQLSARLLMKGTTGCSSSGSDCQPATPSSTTATPAEQKQRKKRIPPYAMIPGSVGGSSGYLADLDNIKTATLLPINSIDLLSRNAKRAASLELVAHNKKRPKPSPDELTYTASRAREDIKKGGLQVPKLQAKRPRIFPPRSNIDMSRVTLLRSANVEKFPFLTDVPGLFSSTAIYSDYPSLLVSSWLKDTQASYQVDDSSATIPVSFQKVVEQIQRQEEERRESEEERRESEKEQSSSDSMSTTSSFTVSDTGNESGMGNGEFAVNVLNACAAEAKHTIVPPPPSTNMISIGEALSICKHPRLLMLGSSPYTVVQANAAFHCLARRSDFLGKPVREIILDASLNGIIKEVSEKHKQVVKEKHIISVQNIRKEATVYAYPVGPCDGELTHLSIELRCETELEGSQKQPLKVMG